MRARYNRVAQIILKDGDGDQESFVITLVRCASIKLVFADRR